MTPLDCVGLAASAVQFVDFSICLVSKSSEIARSVDGRLADHAGLNAVTNDLVDLTTRLIDSKALLSIHTSLTEDDRALVALSEGCILVSKELQEALERLKCSDRSSRCNSVRKALKTVWNKDKVNALHQRLCLYRSQLDSRMLAGVAAQVDLNAARQSRGFQQLEQTVHSVERSVRSANSATEQLTVTIASSAGDAQKGIQDLQDRVEQLTAVEELRQVESVSLNHEIELAISSSEASIRSEQKELSAELSRQLKSAEDQITQLRQEISSLEARIAETIKQSLEANGRGQSKQRKTLNEHVNALYRMWVAKDIILQELLMFVNGVQRFLSKEWVSIKQMTWRTAPYDSPRKPTSPRHTSQSIPLKPTSPDHIFESNDFKLNTTSPSAFLLFKAINDGNVAWLESNTLWHSRADERMYRKGLVIAQDRSSGRHQNVRIVYHDCHGTTLEEYCGWRDGRQMYTYGTTMTPLIFAMFSLHWNHAMKHGPIEMLNRGRIVSLLLEKGANPDVKDGFGYNARQHAHVLKVDQIATPETLGGLFNNDTMPTSESTSNGVLAEEMCTSPESWAKHLSPYNNISDCFNRGRH